MRNPSSYDVLWLLERLKELGLSQKEIAKRIDVPETAIGHWKKRHYKPTLENQTKLVELLHGTSESARPEAQCFVSQDETSDATASGSASNPE
jgi:DNA-binding XRE family transcriptional regulator